MYNEVKLLDDNTINQIAAGEVVEGPFSIVKELVENSIDANSSFIEVSIKKAGKHIIKIKDNGVGVKNSNVRKIFKRHTTSKISNIKELDILNSLGFRGEALASIASISELEIITKSEYDKIGIHLEIIGGKVVSEKKLSTNIGTTIIVKNIFFNTPARRKFLKSDGAESQKINSLMNKLAISKPSIKFKYINNDKLIFFTNGNNNIRDCILSVYGKNIVENLIYFKEDEEDIKIKGFISQPKLFKGNKNLQILYVNNRLVESNEVYKAISEAYKYKLMKKRFPVAFIFIDIPPNKIDTNIHPNKTSIKFIDSEYVYKKVLNIINNSLKEETYENDIDFIESAEEYNEKIIQKNSNNVENKLKESLKINDYIKPKEESFNFKTDNQSNKKIELNDTIEDIKLEDFKQENLFEQSYETKDLNKLKENSLIKNLLNGNILGQIFKEFILIEYNLALYLIDQHAAHEKILFEEYKENIQNETILLQKLIDPILIKLDSQEFSIAINNKAFLKKFGFIIDDFGNNTVVLREVPMILGKPEGSTFFREILYLMDTLEFDIKKGLSNNDNLMDKIIMKSCKSAIKVNHKLNNEEIRLLLLKMKDIEPPIKCPHGRDVLLKVDKEDVKKLFKK